MCKGRGGCAVTQMLPLTQIYSCIFRCSTFPINVVPSRAPRILEVFAESQLSICQMGTHTTTPRERITPRLPRALQSDRHELSCAKERDHCKRICGACHFGQHETADKVSCMDHGIYQKGLRAQQR